jgi:NAD(P)-dependent dehydrogenase (short-subunit alcohol dehydrogenase family)
LAARHTAIHALIHNAGALDKDYALSPQGIERTVASQVLGPFLMTGPLLRNPQQGVDTLVWLVADDGAPLDTTGSFWLDRRPRAIHRLSSKRRSLTAEERDRLWDWCIQHSGSVDDGRTDLVR